MAFKKSFILSVEYRENQIQFFRFSKSKIIIGSSLFNDLHLPLERHFGVHSCIEFKDGNFFIVKLNRGASLKINKEEVISSKIEPETSEIYIENFKLKVISSAHLSQIKTFKNTYREIEYIDT